MARTDAMTLFLGLSATWQHRSFEQLAGAAGKAEEALFDGICVAHCSADQPVHSGETPGGAHYESLTAMAALASRTERIGLVASASTSAEHPFNVARYLSMLDFLSNGRAGWNVVAPEDGQSWDRTVEFLEVVEAFWQAWPDDAVVVNRYAGVWAQADRIRPVRHGGAHFAVQGHLPVHRSPQGTPVIVHYATAPGGADFAARHADVVVGPETDRDGATRFRDHLRERAVAVDRDPDGIRVLAKLSPGAVESAGAADLMAGWFVAGACDGWIISPGEAPGTLDLIYQGLLPQLRERGLARTSHQHATLREQLGIRRGAHSGEAR